MIKKNKYLQESTGLHTTAKETSTVFNDLNTYILTEIDRACHIILGQTFSNILFSDPFTLLLKLLSTPRELLFTCIITINIARLDEAS